MVVQFFRADVEWGFSFFCGLHFGVFDALPGKLSILLLGKLLILAVHVRPSFFLALGGLIRQDVAKIVGLILSIRQQFGLCPEWTLVGVTHKVLLELAPGL